MSPIVGLAHNDFDIPAREIRDKGRSSSWSYQLLDVSSLERDVQNKILMKQRDGQLIRSGRRPIASC